LIAGKEKRKIVYDVNLKVTFDLIDKGILIERERERKIRKGETRKKR